MTVLSAAAALSGCSTAGPAAISAGRMTYAETISYTDKEQTLRLIVNLRYGELSSSLGVSSVTANLKFSARVAAQFGIGSPDSYSGNLVPLAAGVAYEENPTISYLPLRGDNYLRQLLSPVPLELLVLLVNTGDQPGQMLSALVRRANGIANPTFVRVPDMSQGERWERVADLIDELASREMLQFVQVAGPPGGFALAIYDFKPSQTQTVRELLGLLDIPGNIVESEEVLLPVSLALRRSQPNSLALLTRSVFDLAKIAAAAVEVPEEDVAAGFTLDSPPVGVAGRELRIRRAPERPATAMVAVRRDDWWYYIDGRDQPTKRFFRVLEALEHQLWSAAESPKAAPVLTVPVSR